METTSLKSFSYNTSKYYIKFINVLALAGGFDIMTQLLANKESVCNAMVVGMIMNIISNTAPYLLNSFVLSYGKAIIEMAIKYVLEASAENIRHLTKEIVECIYKGVEELSKRVYSVDKSKEITERFFFRIALIFINTDFLERKLHGVTILGEIFKNIKKNEFEKITRTDITKLIEKENVLEQIIKGHPQLITKSGELFKLMFEEDKISDKILELLWSTIRKGDLETKNAITAMLNEIYWEFKAKHTEFFINRMAEVEPKLLLLDEIELAFKLINFWRVKSDKLQENRTPLEASHPLILGPRAPHLLENHRRPRRQQPGAHQEDLHAPALPYQVRRRPHCRAQNHRRSHRQPQGRSFGASIVEDNQEDRDHQGGVDQSAGIRGREGRAKLHLREPQEIQGRHPGEDREGRTRSDLAERNYHQPVPSQQELYLRRQHPQAPALR
jgi:hypothetical protein